MFEKKFHREVNDWAYDRYFNQSVWLKRTLIFLIFCLILLVLSVSTNLILLPLKEKIPYLYAFDHATGEITKIGDLEKSTLNANWELSRYLIMQYVMNYESYNSDNLELPYQYVYAQSQDNVKKMYVESVESSNKNSPYQLYGKDKFITVHISAINKLNDNTVNIKFEKMLHDKTSNSEEIIHKEAILKWNFTQAETTQKMLERDPLGFKVIYYSATQVNL